MKKILFVLLIFVCFKSNGQFVQFPNTAGTGFKRTGGDTLSWVPSDTLQPPAYLVGRTHLAKKGNSIYYWNGTKWVTVAGAGSGSVTEINQGWGILNTPNPITTTGTVTVDSNAIKGLTGWGGSVTVNNGLVTNASGIVGLDSAQVNLLTRDVLIKAASGGYNFQVDSVGAFTFSTETSAGSNSHIDISYGDVNIQNQSWAGGLNKINVGNGILLDMAGGDLTIPTLDNTAVQTGKKLLLRTTSGGKIEDIDASTLVTATPTWQQVLTAGDTATRSAFIQNSGLDNNKYLDVFSDKYLARHSTRGIAFVHTQPVTATTASSGVGWYQNAAWPGGVDTSLGGIGWHNQTNNQHLYLGDFSNLTDFAGIRELITVEHFGIPFWSAYNNPANFNPQVLHGKYPEWNFTNYETYRSVFGGKTAFSNGRVYFQDTAAFGTENPTRKFQVGVKSLFSDSLRYSLGASSGYIIQGDASGNATWVNPTSLTVGNVPLSGVTASTADNTIANGAFTKTMTYNSLAGTNALTLSTTSTAATTGHTLLNLDMSGANSNSGVSTFGLVSTNNHTGTTSTNYGVYTTVTGASTSNVGVFSSVSGASGSTNIGGQFAATASGGGGAYAIIVPASSGSVGIGTSTPAASALLDISSSTSGVLIPRMTTTERNAISSPAAGLMIYNTTDSVFNYYRLSGWTTIGGGGGYTNLTQFVDQTAWRSFYSNGSGDVTELAFGGAGTILTSNGASAAPTWNATYSTISPSQITSDQDNYAPTGWDDATTLRVSGDNGIRAITSFVAPTTAAKPQSKKIQNIGAYPIYFPSEGPDGTADNRIIANEDYILHPYKTAILNYDVTSSRWRIETDVPLQRNTLFYSWSPGSVSTGDYGNISWLAISTGTNSSNAATTSIPGYALFSTSTSASAGFMAYFAKPNVNSYTAFGSSHNWAETLISLPALSDGTETFFSYLQLSNNPGSTTAELNNSCGIRYNQAVNSGKWQLYTQDNAGAESTADLGVTVAANTLYKLRIEIDKSISEVRAYINNLYVGRVTGNMPNATDIGARTLLVKTAGTTARTMALHTFNAGSVYAY